MLLIAVGGEAKDIGKTTLVCNIIATFPRVGWTAAKVSTHQHTLNDSELLIQSLGVSIWRQNHAGDDNDTARFLKAGARRALFVQSGPSNQQLASEMLLKQLYSASYVIVESTQMAEFLNPSLFLVLLGSDAANSKPAQELFERVHAFVRTRTEARLKNGLEGIVKQKPVFEARREGLDPELTSLISALIRSSV